jgi:type II secretory pathway component PulC
MRTLSVLVTIGCAVALVGAPLVPASAQGISPMSDLVLSGVVIAGERRAALLQDRGTSAGAVRYLPLGAALAGHTLVDVREDSVTFEGRGGERTIVRLGAGGGPAQGAPARVSEAGEPRSVEAKEERQARRRRQNADEKLRALMLRGAGADPAPPEIRER